MLNLPTHLEELRPGRPRSARAHQAIISAAVKVAAEQGYGGASIEAIARRAGVGKQTIYRRWPSKAALFIEVYSQLVPSEDLAPDSGSLRGDLLAVIVALFDIYGRTPARGILAGLVADAQSSRETARLLHDTYMAPRRHIIGDLLIRGRDRGEVKPYADLDFATDLVSAAIWFRLLLGAEPLDAEFGKSLADSLLDGLAA